jgi:hypothetical protein
LGYSCVNQALLFHSLARFSAKERQGANLLKERDISMPAYNLTNRQEQILREIVAKCPQDQEPQFFYYHNSMFQGVSFNNSEKVALNAGDLRVFETEQFVSLTYHDGGILGGQITQWGFAAVAGDFQNPQSTAIPLQQVVVQGNGNVVNTTAGNGNVTNISQRINLPDPATVDIVRALKEIQQLLAGLEAPDQKKINNATEEALDEAARGTADKTEIGTALERAFKFAERTGKLAMTAAALSPHLAAAVSWLGPKWHDLLHWIGRST